MTKKYTNDVDFTLMLELLKDTNNRVRNVEQGPDGYLYLGVEGKGILKIIPKSY